MKINIRFLMLFVFLIITTLPLIAQDTETLYVKIDYFMPAPGQAGEYEELELELWKPLHMERYERGIIKSWNLYQVVAGEPDAPYQYIAINVFDDFSKIDYFDLEDIMQSVYPDKNPAELMQRTRKSREVTNTEIWKITGKITGENTTGTSGNYLTVNYFDSRGGSGEHVEMELDFWGAIHETRIEQNILNSWSMYTMLFPGGDARYYTYGTIDYYNTLEDIMEPVGNALARIAHPDLNDESIEEFFDRTADARSVYKVELWKRLGSVGE